METVICHTVSGSWKRGRRKLRLSKNENPRLHGGKVRDGAPEGPGNPSSGRWSAHPRATESLAAGDGRNTRGSRSAEELIDAGQLGGHERSAAQLGQRARGRIVGEQRAQLLPGGMGLQEGEIALGELCATQHFGGV